LRSRSTIIRFSERSLGLASSSAALRASSAGSLARAGALDRAGFHLALADADEALGRQAQHRAAVGQLLEAGKRCRAGLAQGLVGRHGSPWQGARKRWVKLIW
jgi:hypothetical protein